MSENLQARAGGGGLRDVKAGLPAGVEGLRTREAGKRRKPSWKEADVEDKPERKVKAKTLHDDSTRIPPVAARSRQSESSSGDEDGQTVSPKSRFMGVHWNRRKRKWRVRIKAHGRDKHVGYFNDEEDAAWAYDRAVVMHNPLLASDSTAVMKLNFPEAALKHAQCAPVAPQDEEDEDEGASVGAINMILAASQSPSHAASGVELETPPPHPAAALETFAVVAATPCKASATPGGAIRALGFHAGQPEYLQGSPDTHVPSTPTVFTPVPQGRGDSPQSLHTLDDSINAKRSGNVVSPSLLLSCRATPSQPSKIAHQLPNLVQGFAMLPASQVHVLVPPGHVQGTKSPSKDAVKEEDVGGSHVHDTAPSPHMHGATAAVSSEQDGFSQTCSSPSSLCHENELEALKGLVELAGGLCGDDDDQEGTFAGGHAQTQTCEELPAPTKRSTANTKKAPPQLPKRRNGVEGTRAAAQKGWMRDKGDVGSGGHAGSGRGGEGVQLNASRRNQSFRGVTWDKMKKMWRVRVCLAGGGREHVGYFLNEKEGALAYTRALARIRQIQSEQNEKSSNRPYGEGAVAAASAARDTSAEERGHAENQPISATEVHA